MADEPYLDRLGQPRPCAIPPSTSGCITRLTRQARAACSRSGVLRRRSRHASRSASTTASRRAASARRHRARPAVCLEDGGAERALARARHDQLRGTSAYNDISNLLVLRGTRDGITGSVPLSARPDDRHIVPKTRPRDHALETSIDTILKRTSLTAQTNRNVIRERSSLESVPGQPGNSFTRRARPPGSRLLTSDC